MPTTARPAEQPDLAVRSAGATTSGSKAVNEDSEDMPILTDGRFSIRAEAVVETKDLRELTGNRHRQDPEHVRYLREHGDADTLASDLLGRDGTQPAPNPRRRLRPSYKAHCTTLLLLLSLILII